MLCLSKEIPFFPPHMEKKKKKKVWSLEVEKIIESGQDRRLVGFLFGDKEGKERRTRQMWGSHILSQQIFKVISEIPLYTPAMCNFPSYCSRVCTVQAFATGIPCSLQRNGYFAAVGVFCSCGDFSLLISPFPPSYLLISFIHICPDKVVFGAFNQFILPTNMFSSVPDSELLTCVSMFTCLKTLKSLI